MLADAAKELTCVNGGAGPQRAADGDVAAQEQRAPGCGRGGRGLGNERELNSFDTTDNLGSQRSCLEAWHIALSDAEYRPSTRAITQECVKKMIPETSGEPRGKGREEEGARGGEGGGGGEDEGKRGGEGGVWGGGGP
ncbi:unnamed protein product [Pleuronectes platessa]|uniref:Uncharacterized protein n=1 Tax=Pleuronectes platessa TaxID=8262 RepID=A0A9N7YUS1_PLEPL|nr:unnamed protein product [Pleuronectes platessa]